MDVRLEQALDLSKTRYTLFLEKRRLQEKLKADLTYSVNGGQFYIDRNFIVYLNLLVPSEGTVSATMIISIYTTLVTLVGYLIQIYMAYIY